MESRATGKILAITLIGVITLTCAIAFVAGLHNQSKLKEKLLKKAASEHTIKDHGKILLNHPQSGAVNAAPPGHNNVDFSSGYFYDEWADPNSIHYHDPYYRSYHDQYMQYLQKHPEAAHQYNQQYVHYYGTNNPGVSSASTANGSTISISASSSNPTSGLNVASSSIPNSDSTSTTASNQVSNQASGSSSTDSTPQYVMGSDGKFVQINSNESSTSHPTDSAHSTPLTAPSEHPKSDQNTQQTQSCQPQTLLNTLQPVQRAHQETPITTPHLGPTEALYSAPRLAEAPPPKPPSGLVFDPLPGIIPAVHADRVIKDKYVTITVHGANEQRAPPRKVVVIRQPSH